MTGHASKRSTQELSHVVYNASMTIDQPEHFLGMCKTSCDAIRKDRVFVVDRGVSASCGVHLRCCIIIKWRTFHDRITT